MSLSHKECNLQQLRQKQLSIGVLENTKKTQIQLTTQSTTCISPSPVREIRLPVERRYSMARVIVETLLVAVLTSAEMIDGTL